MEDAETTKKVLSQLDRTDYPRLRKMWADSEYQNYELYAHIKTPIDGSWELDLIS